MSLQEYLVEQLGDGLVRVSPGGSECSLSVLEDFELEFKPGLIDEAGLEDLSGKYFSNGGYVKSASLGGYATFQNQSDGSIVSPNISFCGNNLALITLMKFD